MRFAGIDLPQGLVSAHADGQVVFFVGAGASMAAPTRLPSFGALTQRIAKLAGAAPPTAEELAEPDVFLGRLDAVPGVDVHRLVEQEIRRGRKRNRLHDALAVLAAASGAPRLVTTNYDDHLHRALTAHHLVHTVFEAPALPDGNDFEGLVHLHGRIGQPPRRLVVTDADFGTAYITRGWAPAFLRDVFSEFVVCFVGYSHDDRMMDYLAKGLPSNAKDRYIITEVDDGERWERLRINPILYPHREHAAVIDLLGRWGSWARDTPYDRAGRIRLLAGATPPADPDDYDFLAASLNDPALVREVCAIAEGAEWSDWMVQQAPFRALVGDGDETVAVEARRQVAQWVADQAAISKQSNHVYQVVSSSTGPLDPLLISAVLWSIERDDIEPDVRSVWLRWALASADLGIGGQQELELLWASDVELSWDDTMLLLDYLANRWTPERRTPIGWTDAPRVHLDHGLDQGIKRLQAAADAEALHEILNWATAYFEQAHRRVGFRGRAFDGWSYARSSITPDGQDHWSRHDPENVLIDLARDTLATVRTRAPQTAITFRQIWLASRAPLLQRLALHEYASMEEDPGRQVAVLIEHDLLFDGALRHEVYELVAVATPKLTDEQFANLVAKVSRAPAPMSLDGSGAPDERRRDRNVYSLLHWLVKHRPGAAPPAELSDIQRRHPKWSEDDHPDFTRHMTSGVTSLEDEWPWQPDEFHAMVANDPQRALEHMRKHSPSEPDIGWWGAGNMLEKTVEKWPEDGFGLWATADAEERGRILAGWATAPMSDDQLDRVVQSIVGVELAGTEREVARLLRPWTNDGAIADRWVRRPDGRTLARRLQDALTESESSIEGGDLYTAAINSTPGTLAEFWVAAAVEDARQGTYPGGGLSIEVADGLEDLIQPAGRGLLAQAPLVLHMNFLFRADPAWTRAHLFPLIDPHQRHWSEIDGLWNVLLSGQFSDDLIQQGLLEWIPDIAPSIEAGSTIARAMARVCALIAVQSTIDDGTRIRWLTRFVARAPLGVLVQWTREVADMIDDFEPEARTSLWHRWMRTYLRQRADGSPRALAAEETTVLVGWLPALPDVRDLHEGIDQLLRAGTGLASSTAMWRGLDVSDEALRHAPDEWARLIARLLTCTEALPWGLDRWIDSAIATLEDAGAAMESLQVLKRERFRFGGR